MLLNWRKYKEHTCNKPEINLTAKLIEALKPGFPALFLYNGSLIRTSAVQVILEDSPDQVKFETKNSIYTISYDELPQEGVKAAA